MKKAFIILNIVVIGSFLWSCSQFIQVTRTVTKTINLPYNINQVGNFSSSSTIGPSTIVNLFATDTWYKGATIKEVDIQGFSVGAAVASNNTASQVQVGATIKTLDQVYPLMAETKVIQIQSNTGLDIMNAIGAVTGLDNNRITLHNAIELLKSEGTNALRKAFKDNLANINNTIIVDLNGKVPPNQRLVMNLTIQIKASITFTACENSGIPFLGVGESCGM